MGTLNPAIGFVMLLRNVNTPPTRLLFHYIIGVHDFKGE